MIELLENAWMRFALSGTLITVYMVADLWTRRREPARVRLPMPRWKHALIFVSLTAYYLLIEPTGGPLAGGLGNLAGLALVGVAVAMRALAPVRYPELGARAVFYVALPIAVGVPWGLLALSVPACAASVYACLRAERLAGVAAGLPRHRMVPGLW